MNFAVYKLRLLRAEARNNLNLYTSVSACGAHKAFKT